ncbi:MAG: hypothetical protein GWP08_09210 [Nitrospiraceae bacterium]|nr:hypothetical protein [Nitrospiraceae bacterium]
MKLVVHLVSPLPLYYPLYLACQRFGEEVEFRMADTDFLGNLRLTMHAHARTSDAVHVALTGIEDIQEDYSRAWQALSEPDRERMHEDLRREAEGLKRPVPVNTDEDLERIFLLKKRDTLWLHLPIVTRSPVFLVGPSSAAPSEGDNRGLAYPVSTFEEWLAVAEAIKSDGKRVSCYPRGTTAYRFVSNWIKTQGLDPAEVLVGTVGEPEGPIEFGINELERMDSSLSQEQRVDYAVTLNPWDVIVDNKCEVLLGPPPQWVFFTCLFSSHMQYLSNKQRHFLERFRNVLATEMVDLYELKEQDGIDRRIADILTFYGLKEDHSIGKTFEGSQFVCLRRDGRPETRLCAWLPGPFCHEGKCRVLCDCPTERQRCTTHAAGARDALEKYMRYSQCVGMHYAEGGPGADRAFSKDRQDKEVRSYVVHQIGLEQQKEETRREREEFSRVAHWRGLEDEVRGITDRIKDLERAAMRVQARISLPSGELFRGLADMEVLFQSKSQFYFRLIVKEKEEAVSGEWSAAGVDSLKTGEELLKRCRDKDLDPRDINMELVISQEDNGGVAVDTIHEARGEGKKFRRKWKKYPLVLCAYGLNTGRRFLTEAAILSKDLGPEDEDDRRKLFRFLKLIILRAKAPDYLGHENEELPTPLLYDAQLVWAALDAKESNSDLEVWCTRVGPIRRLRDLLECPDLIPKDGVDQAVDDPKHPLWSVVSGLEFGRRPADVLMPIYDLLATELAPRKAWMARDPRPCCLATKIELDTTCEDELRIWITCEEHLPIARLYTGNEAKRHGLSGALYKLARSMGQRGWFPMIQFEHDPQKSMLEAEQRFVIAVSPFSSEQKQTWLLLRLSRPKPTADSRTEDTSMEEPCTPSKL